MLGKWKKKSIDIKVNRTRDIPASSIPMFHLASAALVHVKMWVLGEPQNGKPHRKFCCSKQSIVK
jgi:hypothetical protein